jgi:uncharacterized protein YndB with AHSA1/START domain
MSEYTVIREYPYPIEQVWTVLTDTEYVARWTTTGQGGRPEDFAAVPGTKFRLVGKPTIGWAGIVYCEVVAVDAPRSMHFTAIGGFAMSKLLARVRRTMLTDGVPPVLAAYHRSQPA